MRFIISLFMFLFSFSSVFAYNFVEENISLGLVGYGYIPMETDKDILGYGGGGGVKVKYDINKYVGIGLYSGLTISSSNTNNSNNLTLYNDSRFSIIFQRETDDGEDGFVPWGSLGIGFVSGSVKYGDYRSMEDAIGFSATLSAGLKYNFNVFYAGIGAEYSFSRLYGDIINNFFDGYYSRQAGVLLNTSGFNIFGEFGVRF